MSPIAQTVDRRAARAVGTVARRERMCGSPAVPRTRARPRLMKSRRAVQSPPWRRPGSRKSRPWPLRAAAVLSIRPKSPEERSSASKVSVAVPLISSTDLTIWI